MHIHVYWGKKRVLEKHSDSPTLNFRRVRSHQHIVALDNKQAGYQPLKNIKFLFIYSISITAHLNQ